MCKTILGTTLVVALTAAAGHDVEATRLSADVAAGAGGIQHSGSRAGRS